MDTPYGWWFPPDISTHGAGVDQLINWLHGLMLVVFVVGSAFFAYCLIRFRERPGHKATYQLPPARVAFVAVAAIAACELILDLGLSVPVWASVKEGFPDENEAFRVRVVAEQFAWNFHYPGADGVFGRTDPQLMDAENLIGLDRDDPASGDDVVTTNTFHIPVNKPVIADLSSKDVIHNFYIPVLRIKQDVIPGMVIPVWFEATRTGEFQVACAQLCGSNHYTMTADLTVESAEAFDAWYADMSSDDEEEEDEEE